MSLSNENDSDSELIIELLKQTLSEFQCLNLNIETLNNNLDQNIPPTVIANPLNPSPTSLADHQSVDTSTTIAIGDKVIILHRFHGQYGVIGTVYHITRDYYRIRTPLGVEYQKKKKYVAHYTGPGSVRKDKKTYFKVRDNAIKGLENKFTQLQVDQNDLGDIFTIPNSFVLDSATGHYVPSSSAKAINLFTDANQVSLETVCHANAYFACYGATYHGENIMWSGEKILNSCDSNLRDKLVELTRDWSKADIGGPTYLKLLLSLVLSTSEKSLHTLTDKLGRLCITDFPGENVTQAVSFLRGAILILCDNSSTPADLLTLVLRIFKASTCEPFKSYVSSINTLVELNMKLYDLDTLLTMLDGKYINLLGWGEWTSTSPSEGQASGFSANVEDILKIFCFNCGVVGHGVNNCPHARDDKMINLRREIMENYSNRCSSSSNHNLNRTGGGGGDPLLRPPGKHDKHEKYFDGVKKFWCGKPGCRRWTDHTSSEHPGGSAAANLAANASTKTEGDTPSVAGTEASGSPSSSSTITEATGTLATTMPIHHFG